MWSEIQHAILANIAFEYQRVLHMGMEQRALLREQMNDFDRIAALPEKVAKVVVGPDFLAHSLAQPQHGPGIVDHKSRMHLESDLAHTMLARKPGCLPPIRNHLFLPLPLHNLLKIVRPAIGDPIGMPGAL